MAMMARATAPSLLVMVAFVAAHLLGSLASAFSPMSNGNRPYSTRIASQNDDEDDSPEQQLLAALMKQQQGPSSQSSTWWSSEDGSSDKALPFDCTGCGKCCKTEGSVYLSPAEISVAAVFLSVTSDTFIETYASNTITDGKTSAPWIQLRNRKEGPCVFLDLETNQCQIYSVRPVQCSTYPFWPTILQSRQAWNEEVRHADDVPLKENDPIPYWTPKDGGCEGMQWIATDSDLDDITEGVPIAEAAAQLEEYEWSERRFPSGGTETEITSSS
jgi:Fe-S-cluster containining protein